MALEIIGKLIQVNPETTGTGARGEWKRRDIIVETLEQYPRKVCVSCWGDRSEQASNFKPGTELRIAFNLESREFNSRWYTDVRAWKLDLMSGSSTGGGNNFSNQSAPAYSNNDSANMPPPSQGNDDLPF